MNGETKRHIDAARQVLVGVVPNPTSQIDQITNALIYKFMDDMDQAAIKADGEPSFFVGSLEKYAWTRLMDSKMGNQERMNLYSEALVKFSEAKQLPELFRGIFKSAFLPYRSPEVLNLFLNEISYFDYSHPEELGNAYEYLLSIMSSQGDAGQFRTPRHIIDFIVEVVNPTKDDKILDPACGTAGFLISAYRHILSQHDGKNPDGSKNNEKPLTPDQKRSLMNSFEGYDIDPGMVRIAQVNMYLHQFKNPKIHQYDSLSSDERWGDKFDVILANPPFMSPKGGIRPHSKFSVQSNRSEVLFVDYIMSHLRPKGRAGIIVPEGIIFQSGTAYKQLRKNLIEDGLSAVVSLPSGVFNPYAGVKTSILFFDNDQSRKKDEILFIKVSNDGFDLGATKRSIDKNDLPEAIEILTKWYKGEKSESKIASYVSREAITEDGEYNLSANRYGVLVDYSNTKWPMVKIDELCNFLGKGERSASFASEYGKYKFIVSSFNTKACEKADFDMEALIIGDGGSANVHYVNEPFSCSDHTYVLENKDKRKSYLKYVYFILSNKLDLIESGFQGQGLKNVSKKHLKNIRIPLPTLEIQKQIVEELDDYQKIVSGAQQVVDSWSPRIDVDPKWEKVKLDDIAEINKKLVDIVKDKSYNYIDISSVENKTGRLDVGRKILGKNLPSRARRFVRNGDILLSTVRPNLKAFSYLDSLPSNSIASTGFAVISVNENVAVGFWVYFLLFSEYLQQQMAIKMGKGAYPSINQTDVKNLLFPLPPIDVQNKIVMNLQKEETFFKLAQEFITIYKDKAMRKVLKIYNEI